MNRFIIEIGDALNYLGPYLASIFTSTWAVPIVFLFSMIVFFFLIVDNR